MEIPSKIKIGRHWYRVDVKRQLRRKGGMGTVIYADKKIEVATHSSTSGKGFKNEEVADTFWHEFVHAVLHEMGEKKLRDDEAFVTRFASILTRAVLSVGE